MVRSSWLPRLLVGSGVAAIGLTALSGFVGERVSSASAATVSKPLAANAADIANVANPKVAPGRVSWHASFADARASSEKSGKPVLLFQMMGELDKQFC